MKKSGVCAIVGIALLGSAQAADWPQYGGPNRNNVSSETGLADQWPAGGPKVLWETEVHDGYSGPAVKDGKVYLIDREDEKSVLRCFDLESGKTLWTCAFKDPGTMKGKKFAGTRGTPTVTDDGIYVMTGYGTLACIDPKTQQVKWSKNLLEEYDLDLHQWGYAQAPLVHGDLVIVSLASKKSHVMAYDRATGKKVWASQPLGLHHYVSPQVVEVCGTDMVITAGSSEKAPRTRRRKDDEEEEPKKELAPGHIAGLSLKDGSVLWDYTDWRCHMMIPHPTPLSGNRFFLTAGYDAGSAMIRIKKAGNGYDVEELYKTDEVGSQLQQPILVGDHLFIGSNSNKRKDGLACFHVDGKLVWRTKDIDEAPNFERGPFILADGKLILLDGKTGRLHLVKADPAGYTELASAPMVEGNDMAWAPPALSDGKLLVRDWNTLKCIDLGK